MLSHHDFQRAIALTWIGNDNNNKLHLPSKRREMVLYLILSHKSPLISQSLQGDLVRKGDALELVMMPYNLMVDYAFD